MLIRAIVYRGRIVVPCRRFGTICRSHLRGSSSLWLILTSVKYKKVPVLIYIASETWNSSLRNYLNLFGKHAEIKPTRKFRWAVPIIQRETWNDWRARGNQRTLSLCALRSQSLTLAVMVMPECRGMNHQSTPNDVMPDVQCSLISWVGEGKGQTVPRLLFSSGNLRLGRYLESGVRMTVCDSTTYLGWLLQAANVPAANSVSCIKFWGLFSHVR